MEFILEQWPAHYDKARKAILKLETTEMHKLHPIPAYNIQGNLIRPLHYRVELEGALVRMDFSMNYWRVKNSNFYAADIQTIRVLEEPRSLPSKRKILYPSDPGPSKKIRKEG